MRNVKNDVTLILTLTNIHNQRELQLLFTILKDNPLELLILVAVFYGLQRSEVIGLKWSDIDFERKTICINHTVVQTTLNGCTNIIQKDEAETVSSYCPIPLVPSFEKLLCKVFVMLKKHKYKTNNTVGVLTAKTI